MASVSKVDEQKDVYAGARNNLYIHENEDGYRVTSIRLKNFKGFVDSGWIDFRSIIMLLGNNSAGKSSISQSLRMIKEAYNQDKRGISFNNIVGLYEICGDESDLIFKSKGIETCEVLLKIYGEKGTYIYKTCISDMYVDVKVEYGGQEISAEKIGLKVYNTFFVKSIKNNNIFSDEERLLLALSDVVRKFAEKLKYVDATRQNAKREFGVSGSPSEDTFDMLYYLSEIEGEVPQVITELLRRFGYALVWKPIAKNRGSFVLRDLESGIETNMVDNGLGVAQSLHVVVALAASNRSVLVVDSPELHLQPPMQSVVMDSFIDSRTAENSMIIETGSEFMLMRLERRISEEVINRNDVGVYFIEKNSDGEATCIEQKIDEDGKLMDGGRGLKGFFSSDLEDLMVIDQNIGKKHMKKHRERESD